MTKQKAYYTHCSENVLCLFMGGQKRGKQGSPARNYGPKQCIVLWFRFRLLNFIWNMQLHAPAFPESEKQCSTYLWFDLHFIIG